MEFMNITRAIGEYVNGWQVKYKVDGVEYQPFFGLSTYEDALKHADSPNDLRLMIKLDKDNGGSADMGDGFSLEEDDNFS